MAKSSELFDKCSFCGGTGYHPESREGELVPCIVCGGEKYTPYGLNHSQVLSMHKQVTERQDEVIRLKALLNRWLMVQGTEAIESETFIALYNDTTTVLGLEQGALLVQRSNTLSPELSKLVDESWNKNEAGLRYLADKDTDKGDNGKTPFDLARDAYPGWVEVGKNWWRLVDGGSVSGMSEHRGKLILQEDRGGRNRIFNHWGSYIMSSEMEDKSHG